MTLELRRQIRHIVAAASTEPSSLTSLYSLTRYFPPQLRRASVAFRRYSLGATPKTRLKALLNAASES
jgi:hypothetical protein